MKMSGRFFLFIACLAAQLGTFGQGRAVIVTQTDSLTVLQLDSLDILTRLAGDADPTHPYYTFLWVFGDGTFIIGTRDSVNGHIFEAHNNRLFSTGSDANITVYTTGNYSGGSRPPRMAPSPDDFYRSPAVIRTTIKNNLLQNHIDPTPAPLDTSVIDNTLTGMLRLQLNKQVRPQDTLVAILSFRQPFNKPLEPVGGQLFLFFNSRVAQAQHIPAGIFGEMKSSPSPAPPAFSHGKFEHQQSLLHFRNLSDRGVGLAAPSGIQEYTHFLAWDFDSLRNVRADERHLFAEFGVDSLMWELFRDGQGDTLRFLAVMTALDFSSDVLAPLPKVSDPLIDTTGISVLLNQRYYTGQSEFADLDGADLHSKIVAISEVKTPVVSSHDPNRLALYACQCPDSSRHKVVGQVTYSNDGNAPASLVRVTLHVAEQLNLNSIESIELVPAPVSAVTPIVDKGNRTISWAYAVLLEPAASAGFGHPSTQGSVSFSIDLKPGFAVADIEPVKACIVFDVNMPMCTLPVGASDIITEYKNEGITSVLECNACPSHPPEGGFCNGSWWCYLKWLLLLLLLILIVWVIRKVL